MGAEEKKETGTEEEKKETGTETGTETGKETPKTFTQEEVNRMMAKEKNQGRAAVLAELGIKDVNTGKASLGNYQKILDAQKTEDQKNADAVAQAAADKAAAEQRAATAEAKAEAMILGAKPDCVEDVIVLAMGKMTAGSDFKTIISEIKTKYPAFFTDGKTETEEDKKKTTGQKGTGSTVKTGNEKPDGDKTQSLGQRLAAQRKGPANKKSSYFSK